MLTYHFNCLHGNISSDLRSGAWMALTIVLLLRNLEKLPLKSHRMAKTLSKTHVATSLRLIGWNFNYHCRPKLFKPVSKFLQLNLIKNISKSQAKGKGQMTSLQTKSVSPLKGPIEYRPNNKTTNYLTNWADTRKSFDSMQYVISESAILSVFRTTQALELICLAQESQPYLLETHHFFLFYYEIMLATEPKLNIRVRGIINFFFLHWIWTLVWHHFSVK